MNVTHFRHGKEAVLHNITLWTEQIVLLLQFNQLYRGYGRLLETSKNTTHVIKRSDSQPGLSNHRCPPPNTFRPKSCQNIGSVITFKLDMRSQSTVSKQSSRQSGTHQVLIITKHWQRVNCYLQLKASHKHFSAPLKSME